MNINTTLNVVKTFTANLYVCTFFAFMLPLTAYVLGTQNQPLAFLGPLAIPLMASVLHLTSLAFLPSVLLNRSSYTVETFMQDCMKRRQLQRQLTRLTTFWLLVTLGSITIFMYRKTGLP